MNILQEDMMSNLQNALDAVDVLDNIEEELFIDIYNKRRTEKRRREIEKNAEVTFKAIENGIAKKGSFEDLAAALEELNSPLKN
ncbi:MAG: hypothetical protein QG635_613 [Bacteroidota bacterium]|nr:hypothetical protein [Bacteroidota bacterium]